MPIPVSLGTATHSSTSACSLVSSASIQGGDLVVVAIAIQNSASPAQSSGCSDGTNTYTLVKGVNNPGGSNRCEMWYCANCKPVTNPTITCTLAGSYSTSSIQASREGGMIPSPLDVSTDSSGQSGSPSYSTGTLGQASETIYGCNSNASAITITPSSNFNQLSSVSTGLGSDLEYQVVSSTSSVTFAPTFTGGSTWASVLASFKNAALVLKKPLQTYLRK